MRIAVLAASLLGAGLTAGRRYLADRVETQKSTTIEQATDIAMEKLDREVSSILRRNIRQLITNLLIKFGLVAGFFLLYKGGAITAPIFAIIAAVLLVLFLVRDLWMGWPVAQLVLAELREHRWRPKTALTHYVSAAVFDQALNEIMQQTAKPRNRFLLQLAGTSHHKISVEIAEAVAEIARDTGWEKIRPRLAVGFLRAATAMALYSGIMFTIFRLV